MDEERQGSRLRQAGIFVPVIAILLSGCVTIAPAGDTVTPGVTTSAAPTATVGAERTPRRCQPNDTRPRCQTAAPTTETTAPPTEPPTESPTTPPTEPPTLPPTPPTGGPYDGTGTATDMVASALAIDFGTVNVGSTAQASVTFTNSGGDPFGPINIFGGAPPTAEFNASQNCQGTTLPAGGSCMVNYSFSPGSAGTFNDTSSFTISETANQSDGEDFSVSLTGVGV